MIRATTAAPSRTDAAADSHPIATLFLGSGAAAVVVAIASVCALATTADVGRLRDLELFLSARLLLEDGADLNPLAQLPVLFNRPFELDAVGAFVTFLALSIAATLVLFWAAAAVATPFLMAAARACRSTRHHGLVSWLWERAYPVAVVVGFVSPALMLPIRAVIVARRPTILATTLAVSAIAWLVLVALLRRPERIRRFVRVSFRSCFAVAAVVWAAGAATTAFEPRLAQPPTAGGFPNVLLVSIDSLRGDHVHCYDYPRETTPTIDALAREGALFRTVVSPTSWTLPAHLTLLSALPPEQHGVTHDAARLGADALLLSEVLWQAGYTTAGFASAPYLDAAYGYSQGFDHYDDYTIAKRSLVASHHSITSPELIRTVSQWLDGWDQRGRQRPFFLFVHMWDVHYDYTPPPPYDAMFDPGYTGTMTGENFQGPQVHAGMNPRDLMHIIALYDGEIRFTDLHLGYLVDHLRRLGILDTTIVVVTADHGDEFFEHGRKEHKQTLYDETILVPLVIRYPPKIAPGTVVPSQVRFMDIAPTILSLAGVASPPEFGRLATDSGEQDGARSLTPWLEVHPADLPELVAFGDLIGNAPVPIASVRTNAWKLVEEQKAARRVELYHLTVDPGERKNVFLAEPVVGNELLSRLTRWRASFAGVHPSSRSVRLGEEHQERLRALGYGR